MSDWINWDADEPPPIGVTIKLRFVNGVITNPITIVDGRGLNWGVHGYYSWSPHHRNSMGWRISAYQIIERKEDESR